MQIAEEILKDSAIREQSDLEKLAVAEFQPWQG